MVRLVVKHVWSVMSAFSVLRRTAAAPQGSRLITSAPQPTVTASPTTNSTGSAGPCLDGWCMWSTGDGKKTAYSTLVLVSPFIFKGNLRSFLTLIFGTIYRMEILKVFQTSQVPPDGQLVDATLIGPRETMQSP